jgi:hypothetical protein
MKSKVALHIIIKMVMFVAARFSLQKQESNLQLLCSDLCSNSQVASSDGPPSNILLRLEFLSRIGAVAK